ncbi:MAG: hypothetical protein HZB51_03545 [Chloroflexi bacterium]|nr:hypothetical protein [Chloroflexota bacterium]
MKSLNLALNKWAVLLGLTIGLIIGILGMIPTVATLAATQSPHNMIGSENQHYVITPGTARLDSINPAKPLAGYIDLTTAITLTGLSSSVSQVVSMSNNKVAYLMMSTNQVRVMNTDGTQLYLTDLTAALGSRATNRSSLYLYPIANGELIITVEGSSSGCDNNTNNLFAFLRLNAIGSVVTSLTNISGATHPYNCYTRMVELSNGNLAFEYQINGDEYALRIFQPNGTAVTSETSVQKTGTGNGDCGTPSGSTYTNAIAANHNGVFLIAYYCYETTYPNGTLWGVLYNNNGTQITVGSVQHFAIGTYTYSPNQSVMGLTDNNFMVAYTSNNGTNYNFKLVQPNGTMSNAGTYTPVPGNYPSFLVLGDGGFVALDSRKVTNTGYDYFYATGTVYSNSGSVAQSSTDLDSTYFDRCLSDGSDCDSWNDVGYVWAGTATGYAKGISYPNGRTRNLILHSFGSPTAVTLSSFKANAPFDLGEWLRRILGR